MFFQSVLPLMLIMAKFSAAVGVCREFPNFRKSMQQTSDRLVVGTQNNYGDPLASQAQCISACQNHPRCRQVVWEKSTLFCYAMIVARETDQNNLPGSNTNYHSAQCCDCPTTGSGYTMVYGTDKCICGNKLTLHFVLQSATSSLATSYSGNYAALEAAVKQDIQRLFGNKPMTMTVWSTGSLLYQTQQTTWSYPTPPYFQASQLSPTTFTWTYPTPFPGTGRYKFFGPLWSVDAVDAAMNTRLRVKASPEASLVSYKAGCWGGSALVTFGWFMIATNLPTVDAGSPYFSLVMSASGNYKYESQIISFDREFPSPPQVVAGFPDMDRTPTTNFRLIVRVESITKRGFTLKKGTWGDSEIYNSNLQWFAYPAEDTRFQSGTETAGVTPIPSSGYYKTVTFPRAYASVPTVAVWLTVIHSYLGRNTRFNVQAESVTTTGFSLRFYTWGDTSLYADCEAKWLAFGKSVTNPTSQIPFSVTIDNLDCSQNSRVQQVLSTASSSSSWLSSTSAVVGSTVGQGNVVMASLYQTTCTATISNSPLPTDTLSFSLSASTSKNTATFSATHTLLPTGTRSSSSTKTLLPTASRTSTFTETATRTSTASGTSTITPPPTDTQSATPTPPPTPTASEVATGTETVEPTVSATQSLSPVPVGCAAYKNSVPCFGDSDCFWSKTFDGCMNRTFQLFLRNASVDALRVPKEADILRPVVLKLFGGGFLKYSQILMIPPTSQCPEALDDLSYNDAQLNTPVTVQGFPHMPLYVYSVSNAGVTVDGEYRSPCVRFWDGQDRNTYQAFTLGQSIRFLFDPRPEISFCKFSDPIYVFAPFSVVVEGFNLRTVDSVAVVPGTDTQLCSSETDLRYFPVANASWDRKEAFFNFVILLNQPHVVCYKGSQKDAVPVFCPEPLFSAGLAPWMDPIELRAASDQGPTINTRKVVQFNDEFCKSSAITSYRMIDITLSAGPLIHPERAAAEFGNLSNPYQARTVCLYLMKPPDDGARKSIEVLVDMAFADETETVFILAPTENTLVEQLDQNPNGKGYHVACDPQAMDGFRVAKTIIAPAPGKVDSDGMPVSSKFSIRLPLKGGALVMVCSDQVLFGGSQIVVSYSLGDTLCPNDCKDSTGVVRGICSESLRTCACFEDYVGHDCGTFAGCAGVNESAVEIKKFAGVVKYTYAEKPAGGCAYSLVADPSSLPQKGLYAIGIQLTRGTLSSYDCTKAYILVRQQTFSGTVAARFCKSEFEKAGVGNRLPPLLVNTTQIYVELKGAEKGDGFQMRFTAVSLVCPGLPGPTGFVTASDVCSGLGTCVDLDYAAQPAPMIGFKSCTCKFPYAAGRPGTTCDSCAFGFVPSSFPNCKRADICPNNCSFNGICIEDVGCQCDTNYYGRACNFFALPDIEESEFLITRFPFDNASGADQLSSGTVEDTFLSCEGQASCIVVARSRGKQLKNIVPASNTSISPFSDAFTRARVFYALDLSEGNGTANASNATTINISSQDTSLLLNRVSREGSVGDYARKLNISETPRDVVGQFSITAWMQITRDSNGWLYAKCDAYFFNDGGCPALDLATSDIQDRFTPTSQLQLGKSGLTVPFGIYVNGLNKRIDVMVMREDLRPNRTATDNILQSEDNASSTTSSSDSTSEPPWLAVRHFRLGNADPPLFDGTWRFFGFALQRLRTGSIEGKIYIDGISRASDPAFVQCFPFLPPSMRMAPPAGIPEDNDVRIGMRFSGGAILIGYKLSCALDELRTYGRVLDHTLIVGIGSTTLFGYTLSVDRGTLIAIVAVGFAACFLAVSLRVLTALRQQTDTSSDDQMRLAGDPEIANQILGGGIETDEAFAEAVAQVLHGCASPPPDFDGLPMNSLCEDFREFVHAGTALQRNDLEEIVKVEGEQFAPQQGEEEEEELQKHEPSIHDSTRFCLPHSPAETHIITIGSSSSSSSQEEACGPLIPRDAIDKLNPSKWGSFMDAEVKPDESAAENVEGEQFAPQNTKEEAHNTTIESSSSSRQEEACGPLIPRDAIDKLDPSTWGSFMDAEVIPNESAAENVNDCFRRWMTHHYRHACYGALIRSRSMFDDREVREKTRLFCHTFEAFVTLQREMCGASNWRKCISPFQSHLLALEKFRLCRTEDDFHKFDDAVDKLCANFTSVIPPDELIISASPEAEGTEVLSASTSQASACLPATIPSHDSKASRSYLLSPPIAPKCLVRRVVDESTVTPPCDPLENRKLLQDLDDTFQQDKFRQNKGKFEEAKDVGEAALGAAAAASVAADAFDNNGDANNSTGGGGGGCSVPKMFLDRLVVVRDGWQVLALLMSGMAWPDIYVDTVGRFAGILSFNFSLVGELDFLYSFYLTCIPTLLASVLMSLLIVLKDRARNVKELEEYLRGYLQRQQARIEAGESTRKERGGLGLILWVCVIVVTTFYLPVTTNSILIVFCHSSIHCRFDCYNDPEHNVMVIFSILNFFFITLVAPCILFTVVIRKIREFHAFVGIVATEERREELWELFASGDPSPFALVYDSFCLKYAFFNCLTMVIKASLAFVVLSTEPNSSAQLIPTIFIECIPLVLFAFASPFTLRVLNVLSFLTQLFVLITLTSNVLARMQVGASSELMIAVAGLMFVVQVIGSCFPPYS